MQTRMSYDDVAWANSEDTFNEWRKKLYTEESFRAIGKLIAKHRGGVPRELYAPTRGSFNVCFRMRFEDGSAIIRFPCPGVVMFPEEKIHNEVAIMRFLEQNTSIPVPHVIYYGMKEDSDGLGPFIIMDYIEHRQDLVDALNTPGLTSDDRPVLDPQISTEGLEYIYSQMCDILLELHKHSFNRIGSLSRIDNDWAITGRPLTLNMNELVQLGNFPRSQLPSTSFPNTSTYMQALADIHLMHLSTQHNDAVDSARDCRRKYIARHLFHRLTLELDSNSEASKLFCCDLRPANVLINKDFKIVAVIDWEFTYAAPTEFAYSPPWWLLLEAPEYWSTGLFDWAATYEPRLKTFLRILKIREEAAIERGTIDYSQRLSEHMWDNWENGRFWIYYGARKSWAFDGIYWSWIDAKYFGDSDGDCFEHRIQLLEKEQRNGIDEFVRRKLEEREERILQHWDLKEPDSQGSFV
ncbi:MAG: hypothetical protein Q9163_002929 [Psora crenata]